MNKGKTKAVVFKKGTKLANAERWTYDDEHYLEVVKEFKYLGIVFSTNGVWKKHIKESVGRARVSATQVLKLSYRCPSLPLSLLLRVYDATVKSALLYGSEIWGVDAEVALDSPSTFFYKKLLRLPLSASNVGVHWYMDRQGINISIRAEALVRTLSYWLNLQLQDATRFPKKCYLMQLDELQKGNSCWAAKIKLILESYK